MRGCFSYLDVRNCWIIASRWYDSQMCLLKVTFITASMHNTPNIPRDPKHSNHATSRPKSLLLPLFKTAISALLTTCSVSNNCCSAIILYHVESWDGAFYHDSSQTSLEISRYLTSHFSTYLYSPRPGINLTVKTKTACSITISTTKLRAYLP